MDHVTVTDQSEVEKIDQRISSAQQIKPTRKFHANFDVKHESSWGRMFQGTKVPRNKIRSRERKFSGTKVPVTSQSPTSRPVVDLAVLEGCKAELTLVLVIYQDGLLVHRQ